MAHSWFLVTYLYTQLEKVYFFLCFFVFPFAPGIVLENAPL